jgi:hypothetical protein
MFATRKSVMEAVQGFDERFALDFNDVDCCLRMRLLGYRVIYAPDAEMIHYEKATRQDVVAPGQQVEMYLRRWRDFLEDGQTGALSHWKSSRKEPKAFAPGLKMGQGTVSSARARSGCEWRPLGVFCPVLGLYMEAPF